MKRLLSAVLSLAMVLSLSACGGAQNDVGVSVQRDAAAAKLQPDGSLSGDLVLYSTMSDIDLEALTACFGAVYPNITLQVVQDSAGNLLERLQSESAHPVADVVWGGLSDSDGTKNAGLFEHWTSSYAAENPPAYQSTNGMYSMDYLSTVVFCVNTDLEEALGLEITSYQDLLQPVLKGHIICADPNSSSSAWNNLCNILTVFGNDSETAWDYIQQLIPNLVITSSSSSCYKAVQQGEYVVGLTYEEGVIDLIKNGADNIRLQYPAEGTSAAVCGAALVKNAPHQENGKALIDFLCSAEGQTALAAYQGGILRYTNPGYTTPADAWLPDADQINWVTRDTAYLTANKSQLLARWNLVLATENG